MRNDDNLPALDNEDIRALNTKKVVDSFESIGELAKEAKKNTRVGLWTSIFVLLSLVLLIGGSYVYLAIKTDGEFLDSVFAINKVSQRYVCKSERFNDTAVFMTPDGARDFKEVFTDSSCQYYSTKR